MDASDVIRKRMQQSQYGNYVSVVQASVPTASSTSCYSTVTTFTRNFNEYIKRNDLMNGMQYCNTPSCSTLCGMN